MYGAPMSFTSHMLKRGRSSRRPQSSRLGVRRLFAGLIAVLLANSVLSCAASAGAIEFDGFPEFDRHLAKVIPQYRSIHPDTTITLRMAGHADHHRKLITRIATGSGLGNVVVIDVGFIGVIINHGGLENLSGPAYEADSLEGRFLPYAWRQGRGADGKQYAIPIDVGPGVMYYRSDMLAKAGGTIDDVIKTWDGYLEYGRRLKRDNVYLIADAGDVANAIVRTGLKDGQGVFFDAEGRSLITSQRFIRAFELAKQVRDEGLDARVAAWTNEWYASLKNGSVATQLSGAWLLGHLKNWIAPNTSGNWRVAQLPDGLHGHWGGTFLAIPRQARDKTAAFQFIKYLTTDPDVQLSALLNIGAFPALVDVHGAAAFDEPIAFLGGQKARRLFVDVARRVVPATPMRGDLVAEDVVMKAALREVLNEGKDVRQALRDAERFVLHRVRGVATDR